MDAVTTAAEERRRRQETLQAEAEFVVDDLSLPALLGEVGQVHRVGSSQLGLMVWRDIDVTVACPRLDERSVTAVGARLGIHSNVREVIFRKETGRFNLSPHYPDGLYLRLSYRQPERQEWNLDIWFVDEPDRQPDLAHVQSLPARLTYESRDAILLIKEAWARRPEYGSSVSSYDIYTAVLDHGVTTGEAFAEWLRSSRLRPTD
jgi:hypothetical protein